MSASSGSTSSYASLGPDTAIASRPALTTLAFPLTGAASSVVPRAAAACRTRSEVSAETVLESTR